jgi:hypothetical protein
MNINNTMNTYSSTMHTNNKMNTNNKMINTTMNNNNKINKIGMNKCTWKIFPMMDNAVTNINIISFPTWENLCLPNRKSKPCFHPKTLNLH